MYNTLKFSILQNKRKNISKKLLEKFGDSKKSRTFAVQLRNKATINKHRGVEQLVARWAHNPKVVCSSQASATRKGLDFLVLFYFPPILLPSLGKTNSSPKSISRKRIGRKNSTDLLLQHSREKRISFK